MQARGRRRVCSRKCRVEAESPMEELCEIGLHPLGDSTVPRPIIRGGAQDPNPLVDGIHEIVGDTAGSPSPRGLGQPSCRRDTGDARTVPRDRLGVIEHLGLGLVHRGDVENGSERRGEHRRRHEHGVSHHDGHKPLTDGLRKPGDVDLRMHAPALLSGKKTAPSSNHK